MAAAVIVLRLWLVPRGIDVTDEGFSLNEIAHPGASTARVVFFGYLWHPLWQLADESVIGLRLMGSLLVMGSAGWLGAEAVRSAGAGSPPSTRRFVVAVAACAASSCIIFAGTPGTPSYQATTLIGLCAVGATALNAWRTGRTSAWIGAGLALAVTAFGKPTSALAALVILLLCSSLAARFRGITGLLLGLVLAGGLSLALIRETPFHILDTALRGLTVLVGHSSVVPPTGLLLWKLGLQVAALLTVAASLVALAVRHPDTARVLTVLAAVVVLTAMGWAVHHFANYPRTSSFPRGVLELSIVFLPLIVLLSFWRGRGRPDRQASAASLMLALFVVAFVSGTNQPLWSTAGQALCLLLGSTLLLASSAFAAAATVFSLGLVGVALAFTPLQPYRSSALLGDLTWASATPTGARILVPMATAHWLTGLQHAGHQGGVNASTPILDLTGDSPGAVMALGGRPLGQGWIVGGYPESPRAASIVLSQVRCELGEAVVLWSPEAPRSIPTSIMESLGVRVPQDYRVAGTVPHLHNGLPQPGVALHVLVPTTVPDAGCPPKSVAEPSP